ncbi:cingulin isoform X2 [Etheostoma cragini]|uniref:cingulin isoform X2 n=1 Tax=Etheostoma cragini TaxID=417921 RepID=UPI00155F0295|nr:cingulin isoform X2 [Etheostoma cragini]
MMSKAPRWPDTLVNSKTNKPAQKTGGKEPAALTVPASNRGKQAGSCTNKTNISVGRSKSLSSRGSDSTTSGSKADGSLKSGSQGSRQASRPARPAFRLCSSRSFSSLHTSSLTASPFMRSSRSLSRLDRRSTGGDSDHAVSSSQVKKGQTAEKRALYSGQLFSSDEQIRDNKDQCHGDKADKMKTSSSSEPLDSSSSLVSTTSSHRHCNKVKKQPALFNFNKGWMMRKDASGQAADVDGEVNLSTCFGFKDYPAQKSCGLVGHTRDGVYALGAMTSGMRHNWVQAVLKNVRPSLTLEFTSSLSVQETHQKSQHADSQSAEGLEQAEHPNSFLQEHKTSESVEETHQQQKKQVKLQAETEESSADASAMIASSSAPPPQGEGVTDVSSCVEGAGSDSSTSATLLSNLEFWEQQVLTNATCEDTKEKDKLPCEQQTRQLVKELEQTQKELSQMQQLNWDLQEELKREREKPSKERVNAQNYPFSNSSSEQALALQRLQKINHDLHFKLEAQKSSQEEAREDELRRRVDLLAQQAQLLVTGDATALAQAHLEQDRRQFHEQQMEWEQCVASLKAQLSASEEQRREAGLRLAQLQQELQSFHSLQQDADRLNKHLQEVTTQLHANEEAQAQKEARLQKHLTLLQASQDRERRSFAASLAQAEQHSHDLQKRLDTAEQQVESLNKTHTWNRDIEEAQQQLQEELTCTVSAVQNLQDEREQIDRRCRELQNQLCEADEEVGRLQSRLKTDETHYYNLEHSYERVSEELQLALGKVQQKESETQDIREGYERLLDRKEQELSEVLLKMEVLGNSLEETEVKLNDVLRGCTCNFSQLKDENIERQTTDLLTLNDSRPNARDSHAVEHAEDYPERYMSVIQMLETKLYVTEEKLRDIMQRLEEHQSHISCQDPHLCSQLTQSRATTQHLSLLLHSRAKQSQRFAQETENRCRMLVGRFQVALNIIQVCRERLQATPINITDFENQLATVAACLQQGEKDAEKQQHESHNESKGEDRILNDETLPCADSNISAQSEPPSDDMQSVGKCLTREVFVVEKMVSVLQSQHGIGQLSFASREDVGDLAQKYKNIISQRIALKTEKRTGRAECDNSEPLERAIVGVCAEAELIYTALKVQHQYESMTQVNNQEVEPQRKSLADITPPELASYKEQVKGEGRGSEGAAKPVERIESDVQKVEEKKEPDWLERLISRLQKRAKSLRQLCQEISDANAVECRVDDNWENASAADLNLMQEQAKLIYLLDRLHSDLEQQKSEVLQDKLQALCEEQDITLKDEQEAVNHTLCQLQEDNSVLREELECAEQKIVSIETGKQRLLEDIQKIEDYHEERMKKLEMGFQEKIRELQQIHEKEMKHLHGHYTKSSKEKQTKTCTETPALTESTSFIPDQTAVARKAILAGGAAAMREAYQKDLEKLETSCHQGVTAMEEMHRQLIGNLQQQHQTEVAALLKEKDKLLQEETSATMAAIVAMRRAHKQELEKSRSAQHIKECNDIAQLRIEYEKEIQLMHKELEVLSVQHTQRCLENSQLSQELQDEKQALMQYQKENQELKKKQKETDEMSQLHLSLKGQQAHVSPQETDFYEMEVILRAREAEMQFLRQEARSLREDLKIARMDKIYAQNKLKALYMNNQDEPYHDVNKLCEDVKFPTWSPCKDASGQSIEETMTNTSNAALLKKTEKSSLSRQIRGVRSKSLKDGLSIQERMKLFKSF